MTWNQRYGAQKAAEMRANLRRNRKKPKPLTTFMRHHKLRAPMTDLEAETAALDGIERLGRRVTRVEARGPYR